MSLAAEEILELSEQVLRSSNKVKGIEAEMVTAIALIESSGNVKAYRYEEHLGEASSGLTQLLQSTAKWLAEDLSYDEYELDLYQPASSLYFCAAYLCWLKTYKSVTRSDEFVVRGYNGGPNGVNLEATVPYS
ncbi:hypothetical protein HOP50_16g76800 [Chloropicon primus]|nr:hypothetical protein HOP50_16g76800 [Chloropicon primus]